MNIKKNSIIKSIYSIEKKFDGEWHTLRLALSSNYEDAIKTFQSQCKLNSRPDTNPLRLVANVKYVDKVQEKLE